MRDDLLSSEHEYTYCRALGCDNAFGLTCLAALTATREPSHAAAYRRAKYATGSAKLNV